MATASLQRSKTHPTTKQVSDYDTKPSDGEVPVLELWGIWSTPLLSLLPGPLSTEEVVSVRMPSMDQIEQMRVQIPALLLHSLWDYYPWERHEPLWVKQYYYCSSTRMALALNNPWMFWFTIPCNIYIAYMSWWLHMLPRSQFDDLAFVPSKVLMTSIDSHCTQPSSLVILWPASTSSTRVSVCVWSPSSPKSPL